MVLGREGAQAFDLRGTLREQFSRFGDELFEPRRRAAFHETAMVLLSRIHSNRRARASSNPVNKFLCAGRRRHELKARNIAEHGSAPARSPWLTDIPRPRNRGRVDPIRSPLSKLLRMIVSRPDVQAPMHLLDTSGVFSGSVGRWSIPPQSGMTTDLVLAFESGPSLGYVICAGPPMLS